MKCVLQRVSRASVTVEGRVTGEIERGILVLVGFGKEDDPSKLAPMAQKLVNLRIFSNEGGRFDFSTLDIDGEVLLVPQFTLFADTRKGRRPEFFGAMAPEEAKRFFNDFIREVSATGVKKVAAGIFGAMMKVSLDNEGPVTIILEL